MNKKIRKLKLFVDSNETNAKLKNISNCFEWEVEDFIIIGKTIKVRIKNGSNMVSKRISKSQLLKEMENENGKV